MPWQKLIKSGANNYDTIALIVKTTHDYYNLPLVTQLVDQIEAQSYSEYDLLEKLFTAVSNRVLYVEDVKGREVVNTADRTLRMGVGDCKKFTNIFASALTQLGIPFYYKAVAYQSPKLAHIYITVPTTDGGYITIDPVFRDEWGQSLFNREFEHEGYILYDAAGNVADTYLPDNGSIARQVNNASASFLESVNGIGNSIKWS